MRNSGVGSRLTVGRWLGATCVASLAACGSGSAPDANEAGTGAGACGTDAGGACNAIDDVGPSVTETCTSDAVPTGDGGTIANGTYVLTAATFYGVAGCSQLASSATLMIAGDCWQEVTTGSGMRSTVSFTVSVQGNQMTPSVTCPPSSVASASSVFTATASTLTIFTPMSGVSLVFTKQQDDLDDE